MRRAKDWGNIMLLWYDVSISGFAEPWPEPCAVRYEALALGLIPGGPGAQIPSDNCPFNELPDMKAAEITEAGKEALRSQKFDMVRMNYANPDMVTPSPPPPGAH